MNCIACDLPSESIVHPECRAEYDSAGARFDLPVRRVWLWRLTAPIWIPAMIMLTVSLWCANVVWGSRDD